LTKRKTVELELEQVTARLLALQDEERRRLARELHDQTAQNLFALTIDLSRVRTLLEGDQVLRAIALLDPIQAIAESSLREIRTLSYVLHPPLLDEAGLVTALRWFAEGFTQRSGIEVEFIDVDDVGRLAAAVETALFRVVQEALTNVQRHSGSSRASLWLTRDTERVTLQVRDYGGALQKQERSFSGPIGVGIPGMRQRLRQLGGDVDVSIDAGGTLMTAHVPVSMEIAP
jgi:two-component system, NarL family, sensor kinase